MALQKQSVSISFSKGRDGKADPWQLPFGKFLKLSNSSFSTEGRLEKRNGKKQLTSLSTTFGTSLLATYQGGLVAIGNALNAYSQSSQTWVNKAGFLPLSTSVQPLIRSAANQNQCDVAVASNGLTCVVYTEAQSGVTSYKYAVFDVGSVAVVAPTAIPVPSGSITGVPRVFALGNYFAIVITVTISATAHLQYVAIPITTPSAPIAAADITATYTPASSVAWDGVVSNNNLYIAWNSSGAAGIKVTYIDSTLTQHNTVNPDASHQCTMMSVTADNTGATPVIWVTYYNSAGTAGYTFALNQAMTTVLAATQIISAGTILNLVTTAKNQTLSVFYEVSNTYGYDTSLASNYIQTLQVPQAGAPTFTVTIASPGVFTTAAAHGLVLGQPLFFTTTGALPTGLTAGTTYYVSAIPSSTTFRVSVTNPATTAGGVDVNTSGTQSGTHSYMASSILVRGLGLASKAFLYNSTTYFLTAFSSANQPTYFLLNGSGQVQGRLAYSNGGGYLTTGLPSAVVIGTTVTIGYLFKDLITTVNRTQGALSSAAVFSQTGVSAVTYNFRATPSVAELGDALHISGGQLWMYDGTQLVEHGFHVFPDNVEVTYLAAPLTPTGTTTSGSDTIASVSSTAGVAVGMPITGTGIPAGTVILAFTVNTIKLSALATSGGAGVALTIGASGSIRAQPDGATNTSAYWYQAHYEWVDTQGNIHRSNVSIPVALTTTGSGTTGMNYINLPTLRETLKTSVKINLFRWSVAQQTFYQVTSLTSPSMSSLTSDYITIADGSSDAQIVGNSILYTTGNVLGNDASPPTNLLAVFDDRLFALSAEDQNVLGFSKEVVEGEPVEFSQDLTKSVTPTLGAQGSAGTLSMMAPMDDKMVLYKTNGSVYYFNGEGPDDTGANNQYSKPTFITSTVGCSNPNVALIPSGLLFQSDKGIWRLGRNLATDYIGAPVEDFNSQTVVAALTIPGTNEVRFMMSGGQQLMYDYYYDQWGTHTGLSLGTSVLFQGLHTSLDPYGRIFQETPGLYLDGSAPVLMSWTTGWFALGGLQSYQKAYWIFILGQYLSPHKLGVGIAYDYNETIQQQFTITPDNGSPLYGGDVVYGSSSFYGGPGTVEWWQVNVKKQACQSFQMTVNEYYDPSQGIAPGAGLTLSGLNVVCGLGKRYPRMLPATRQTG